MQLSSSNVTKKLGEKKPWVLTQTPLNSLFRLIPGWFNETIPAFAAGLEATERNTVTIRLLHIEAWRRSRLYADDGMVMGLRSFSGG